MCLSIPKRLPIQATCMKTNSKHLPTKYITTPSKADTGPKNTYFFCLIILAIRYKLYYIKGFSGRPASKLSCDVPAQATNVTWCEPIDRCAFLWLIHQPLIDILYINYHHIIFLWFYPPAYPSCDIYGHLPLSWLPLLYRS